MHDRGLISSEVYADQQKTLLAQGLGAENDPPPVRTDTKTLPSTAASGNLWKWLVVIVILLFGGIWFASKFGTRVSKGTVIQLASQTGIDYFRTKVYPAFYSNLILRPSLPRSLSPAVTAVGDRTMTVRRARIRDRIRNATSGDRE